MGEGGFSLGDGAHKRGSVLGDYGDMTPIVRIASISAATRQESYGIQAPYQMPEYYHPKGRIVKEEQGEPEHHQIRELG